MHAFAREQQPNGWTNSSTQRSPLALNVAARVEHNVPHCESKLSRKESSTADSKTTPNSPVGASIGLLIDSSRATILPVEARQKLPSIPAATLQRIRIHDDHAAHQAADKLNARAFTIGPSIYFGRGEYQPTSQAGMRVLAHETAHAHQQANTSLPPADQLLVSDPSSKEEHEAETFAANVSNGKVTPPPAQVSSGSLTRLMRVTFEGTAEKPVTHDIGESFKAAPGAEDKGFRFGWSYPIIFSWSGSATMRGTPIPGSDWRIGMTQTLKDYWMRIWWKGHSCLFSFPNQMIKDSGISPGDIGNHKPATGCPEVKAEEPWFDYCKKSQPFLQDGQTETVSIDDSPGFFFIPYRKPAENPNASGRFEFGATYFAFLTAYNSGAQETPDEPRFQHLKRVYWQTMLEGNFNGKRATPEKRVKITDAGKTEALEVRDYTPDGPQPVVWEATASDLLNNFVFPCINKDP